MANPGLDDAERADLVGRLMKARRGAKKAADPEWDDSSPDLNRHMAENTLYAEWYAKLARSNQGGP